MSGREDRIRGRIEKLSDNGRRALAELLAEGRTGPARLVAHVQPATTELSETDLLAFLAEELPDYMVPAQIRTVEGLPVTRAGKVDRRALARAVDGQAPPADTRVSDESDDGPRKEVEQILADIWMAVLDTDQVGIHDDFFELGGDSILSIRVISRAKKAGLVIDSPDFFTMPTIAHLATIAKRVDDAS